MEFGRQDVCFMPKCESRKKPVLRRLLGSTRRTPTVCGLYFGVKAIEMTIQRRICAAAGFVATVAIIGSCGAACAQPPAATYTLNLERPRLFLTKAVRKDVLDKIAKFPEIWRKDVIATAEGPQDRDGAKALCSAAVYQLMPAGFTYKLSREEYGRQALTIVLTPNAIPDLRLGGNPIPNSLNFSEAVTACVYDWCYDLMGAEER